MDALRNYLACQAEIGTDEVILTRPFSLKAAVRPAGPRSAGYLEKDIRTPDRMVPAPKGVASAVMGGTQSVPILEPGIARGDATNNGTAPPGLFQMLVKSLAESEGTTRAAKANELGLPGRGAQGRLSETLSPAHPAFTSLAECRAWLEGNLRGLLTGAPLPATARIVQGLGPESASLALVAMEPSPEDLDAGRPFTGECGLLLGKMMRAIRLDIETLYCTMVVKAGGGRRAWTRRDLVRILPLLQAELALARVPVVLLLGETCAQAVLRTGRPLDELRGAFHRVEGFPGRDFAVTYHPDDLAGNEDLKRKAWKDLQWLQPRLPGN